MRDITIEIDNNQFTDYYKFHYVKCYDVWAELYIKRSANYKFDISSLKSNVKTMHIYVQTDDDFNLDISNSTKEHHCDFQIHNCSCINDNYLPEINMSFSDIHGFQFQAPSLFTYGFYNSQWQFMELSHKKKF